MLINAHRSCLLHRPTFRPLLSSPHQAGGRLVRIATASRANNDIDPPHNVCAVILGGAELDSKRLFPLTERRTLPAIPLCGNYRLIDIPVSNCINAGLYKIYVLTQFNSTSLNRYLTRTYDFSQGIPIFGGEGFMEVVAAQQSPDSQQWADGPADSVRQWLKLNEGSAKGRSIEDILILPSDQIYRIDLARLTHEHRKSNSDITIVSHVVSADQAKRFGILTYDDDLNLISFKEKPSNQEALKSMSMPWKFIDMAFAVTTSLDDEDTVPVAASSTSISRAKVLAQMTTDKDKQYVASCGIYLIKAKVLKDILLTKSGARTFSRDIIPDAINQGRKIRTYPLKGFFDDIGGSVRDYYDFSIGVAKGDIPFSFIDPVSPIFSCPAILPPNCFQDSKMKGVQVGSGCTILRSTLTNSIIGARSQIGEGCVISDTVIMGNDFYEDPHQSPDTIPVGIGSDCEIHKTIIDKNVRIGSDVKLLNKEGIVESDRIKQGIWIRDGIIVVAKSTVVESGTIV